MEVLDVAGSLVRDVVAGVGVRPAVGVAVRVRTVWALLVLLCAAFWVGVIGGVALVLS